MKPKTMSYYDWHGDFEPELIKNINELLAKQNIDPIKYLHGGYLKDGKWVDVGQGEYRNFWHVYLDMFVENLRNDNYVVTYFPDDSDEDWEYARKSVSKGYGDWAVVVLDAVRKTLKDNGLYDENGDADKIVFWFSW